MDLRSRIGVGDGSDRCELRRVGTLATQVEQRCAARQDHLPCGCTQHARTRSGAYERASEPARGRRTATLLHAGTRSRHKRIQRNPPRPLGQLDPRFPAEYLAYRRIMLGLPVSAEGFDLGLGRAIITGCSTASAGS